MPDIRNVSQALAFAKATDENAYEHSVIITHSNDDIRSCMQELEIALLYYTLVPRAMESIQSYFEWFSAQLAENEAPADDEKAVAHAAEKLIGEAEAVSDKLRLVTSSLKEALNVLDDTIDMAAGVAQGTKDLTTLIQVVIDG